MFLGDGGHRPVCHFPLLGTLAWAPSQWLGSGPLGQKQPTTVRVCSDKKEPNAGIDMTDL